MCMSCLRCFSSETLQDFNAAIPASTSKRFTEQANYLIQKFGLGTELEDKWKFITIYIGLNDLSVSCMPGFTFIDYFARMDQGLALLKKNVKNAFVNLGKCVSGQRLLILWLTEKKKIVGMLHIEETIKVTDNEPGYRKFFKNKKLDVQDKECYCCKVPAGSILIKLNVELFNNQLKALAKKYSSSEDFTVVYQPFSPDINKIPVHALRLESRKTTRITFD